MFGKRKPTEAEGTAAPAQAPTPTSGNVKMKSAVPEPVSREEFDSLADELKAHKMITAVAVSAFGLASKSSPGTLDSDCRKRFEKLAEVADFDTPAREQLKSFFTLLDELDKAEGQRQFRVQQASLAPRTFANMRVPNNWRG